jgi:hypothetical protein
MVVSILLILYAAHGGASVNATLLGNGWHSSCSAGRHASLYTLKTIAKVATIMV